ncbi:MAG: hypothetical protein ABI651_16670 [Verrucomicrobiota bacterium]
MNSVPSPVARTVVFLIASAFVIGCQHVKSDAIPSTTAKQQLRNNCCSLLYEIFEAEKNVSKLLIIKSERPEVNRLIKDISSSAAAGAKKLEEVAKRDHKINLQLSELPPGERATRDAISKTRTRELLLASGADFELKLLLTQVEALSYASHLAKVAAKNEPQPDLAREFAGLSDEIQRLYSQVIALLNSRISPASGDKGQRKP